MKTPGSRFLWIALLVALAIPAQAYNAQVAVATPVTGIVLDGDLCDWPSDLTPYAITFPEYGEAPRDSADFRGQFRVGYNEAENALYLAVEVQDESVMVTAPQGAGWNTQDGCEIFLSLGKPPIPGVIQYTCYGNTLVLYGRDGSMEAARVAVQRTAGSHRYEWRVDLGQVTLAPVRLQPGGTLWLDVAANDKDADGSFSWIAWGKGVSKLQYADRLGLLVLVAGEASPGEVVTQVQLAVAERAAQTGGMIAQATGYQMFFTGVLLAVTLLHLLLFLFDRQWRPNLYYALYTGFIAAAIFLAFQTEFAPGVVVSYVELLRDVALGLVGVLGLLFLYSLFYPRFPKRFWVLLLLLSGPAYFVYLGLTGQIDLPALPLPYPPPKWLLGGSQTLEQLVFNGMGLWVGLVWLMVYVEYVRVLLRAVRQKQPGAWIIAVGFLAFALNLSPLFSRDQIDLSLLAWVLLPLISMSMYLAHRVARTNRELQVQLRQVRELSAKALEQNQALTEANLQIQAQNRELEEANRQIQEANRLKSQFLANMSHELRTPMNAIVGFSKIVYRKAQGVLPPRQLENLERISQSAEILMNLINDILDLSKIEAGKLELQPERFSLKELVEGCVSTVSPMVKPGVELRTELSPELPPIYTDLPRLRQILINLLSNAAKFTEKGSITIAARPAAAGGFTLSVADTGIGIPAQARDYIFEEFRQVDGSTTRKYGGTGLGLSISLKLARMLGGTIAVESEEGKGSVFTVALPLRCGPEPAPVPVADTVAPVVAARRLIVAIDDDPDVLSLLTQELEEEGYQVRGFTRAAEGIAQARELCPYAITLDIMLPGMDGWEAIGRLKSDPATRDIPLIVLSIIDNRELGFRLGADDYLVKPIDKQALFEALRRFEGRGRRLLVADDDPAVAELMRQLLGEEGWQIRAAADGQQALDQIALQQPDLLLLDLMMPGVDGFEVLRRLRQQPETAVLPVVVITAKDLSAREREALRLCTVRVIEKDGLARERILRELRASLAGLKKSTL